MNILREREVNLTQIDNLLFFSIKLKLLQCNGWFKLPKVPSPIFFLNLASCLTVSSELCVSVKSCSAFAWIVDMVGLVCTMLIALTDTDWLILCDGRFVFLEPPGGETAGAAEAGGELWETPVRRDWWGGGEDWGSNQEPPAAPPHQESLPGGVTPETHTGGLTHWLQEVVWQKEEQVQGGQVHRDGGGVQPGRERGRHVRPELQSVQRQLRQFRPGLHLAGQLQWELQQQRGRHLQVDAAQPEVHQHRQHPGRAELFPPEVSPDQSGPAQTEPPWCFQVRLPAQLREVQAGRPAGGAGDADQEQGETAREQCRGHGHGRAPVSLIGHQRLGDDQHHPEEEIAVPGGHPGAFRLPGGFRAGWP